MRVDFKEYAVQGFQASSVAAGIKKDGTPDMALIFSEREAVAAGVFTTNKVKAAPVVLSQEKVQQGKARAIIANSGNANACTGRDGLNNVRRITESIAKALSIKPDEVLAASTGLIGAQLPMDLIDRAIPRLAKGLSPDGIPQVAEAIKTTDTFPKMSRFEGEANGCPYRILGIAKGAGMIMPTMATMLCFILSDIPIDAAELSRAVASAARTTFNRISVDGDTSTNDTVLALANGMAGNKGFFPGHYEGFQAGLTRVMDELATMIVRDGEGATKMILVKIKGAATDRDALTAARTIANSYLVKTAFYGHDPNWGRVMAALGRSGIRMREEVVQIWVDEVRIVEGGLGTGDDNEKLASERMAQNEFSITIDLKVGQQEDEILTCDLTPEYIRINADYRT